MADAVAVLTDGTGHLDLELHVGGAWRKNILVKQSDGVSPFDLTVYASAKAAFRRSSTQGTILYLTTGGTGIILANGTLTLNVTQAIGGTLVPQNAKWDLILVDGSSNETPFFDGDVFFVPTMTT